MIEQFLAAIAAGGVGGTIVIFLVREWLSERLKQSIGAEYARQLELHKKELELRLTDQVRVRKMYEDLSMSLEEAFGRMKSQDPVELSIAFNKMFALLALYAPDDVYRSVKDAFYLAGTKTVYASQFRPVVYYALRKSLLGEQTRIRPEDLVDNIEANPVAHQNGPP